MVGTPVHTVAKAGLGEDVRKGVEAADIKSCKGGLVVVTKVVEEYGRSRGRGDGDDSGGRIIRC